MFGELIKSFGDALIPVKRLDAQGIMRAIKNPIKYKKLTLDEKQAHIIYLDPEEIKIIGGIEISNAVINPELGKGWITDYKMQNQLRLEKKRCYICHPKIPYVLTVNEADFHKVSTIPKKVRALLGLPEDWLQLQPEMIAMMAMKHWNQGFDERPGSVMIWLFGFAVGGVTISMLLFMILLAIGLFHK